MKFRPLLALAYTLKYVPVVVSALFIGGCIVQCSVEAWNGTTQDSPAHMRFWMIWVGWAVVAAILWGMNYVDSHR